MKKNKLKSPVAPYPPDKPSIVWFQNFQLQVLVLICIGFCIYWNTFKNLYAFDDQFVIQVNEYVRAGIKGIPKILSTDAYDSYLHQINSKGELSGGRYRPLSIVTFAIEQEIFGMKEGDSVSIQNGPGKSINGRLLKFNTEVSLISIKDSTGNIVTVPIRNNTIRQYLNTVMAGHIGNVVLYILLVVSMMYFLRRFYFKANPNLAFLAAFLFLIHPIHTEVVANIKSRDEILSLLFIIITMIFAIRHRETNKRMDLWISLTSFFLALLSKEYGITLVVLLPVLYFLIKGDSLRQSLLRSWPYYVVAVLFIIIRFSIVGIGRSQEITELYNNPYLLATPVQKIATKIMVLNKYLYLLLWPNPLSADYSYNSIPYQDFKSLTVWFSIMIHAGLIAAAIALWKKKNPMAFIVLFYLFNLFLVSNFALDIGATMGERLIFHSSFGFSIALAYFIGIALGKIKRAVLKQVMTISLLLLIGIPCCWLTIKRNPDWYDSNRLFMHDVKVVPQSLLANSNAASGYIGIAEELKQKNDRIGMGIYLDSAISCLKTAIGLHPRFYNAYINLGAVYYLLEDYFAVENYWNKARECDNSPDFATKYDPALGQMLGTYAVELYKKQDYEKALESIQKAARYIRGNADVWYYHGLIYTALKNITAAKTSYEKALSIKPDFIQASNALNVLNSQLPGHKNR